MKGYTPQKTRFCGNCAHFRQHYVRCEDEGEAYAPLSYGHCVYPALKRRCSEETCPLWRPRPPKTH